jgi:hypothetical protein
MAHIMGDQESCDSRPADESKEENRKKTVNLGSPSGEVALMV